MKKILKYFLINILLFFLILLSIDYSIYLKSKLAYYKNFPNEITNIYSFPNYTKNYESPYSDNSIQYLKQKLPLPFHKTISNYNKTILLFGCSYTNGTLLNYEQTVEYKLSKLMNSNVFNFSICACGIQHMLYIIQHNFFGYIEENSNIPSPDIALYIYIPSHLQRLQANIFPSNMCNGINLQYTIKNNRLEVKNFSSFFVYKSFLIKAIYEMTDKKIMQNELKYKYTSFMLANEMFLESRRLLKEKYPNIKFIILRYQTEDDENFYELPFMWDVLRSEGFTIINSEDLTGRKFKYNSEDTVEDGYHPSEKSWDLLVPELVKKLNL